MVSLNIELWWDLSYTRYTVVGQVDAVHILSRKLHAPTKADPKLARGVIAFLLSTDELGLTYNGNKPTALEGFSDADWAGDLTTRRSTSGFVFLKNNATIS